MLQCYILPMPIRLSSLEKRVAREFAALKERSGSHSPSPAMLKGIKGVSVTHDFCYLGNPYATEVFLKYFRRDFKDDGELRSIVAYYPSQNRALAKKLERVIAVPSEQIFVGNGATEIIQAVLSHFVQQKVLVPIPTFSPYLEFAKEGVQLVRHQLQKADEFRLNTDAFLAQVRKERPDTVVIINPNNPDGGYINPSVLRRLFGKLKHLATVIVDESFIHFTGKRIHSIAHFVSTYPNLVVIKSLSKDFGIAGLRLGYGVMSKERVSTLLARGYLWNVSGFGEYFLNLLSRKDFLKEYKRARERAVGERDRFFRLLSRVQGLKVYPSLANSFLIEIQSGGSAADLTVRLLVRHGIYVRECSDKVGLKGEFIRVACRTTEENSFFLAAIQRLFPQQF